MCDIFESSLKEPPDKKKRNLRTSTHEEPSQEEHSKPAKKQQQMLKKDKLISKQKLYVHKNCYCVIHDLSKPMSSLKHIFPRNFLCLSSHLFSEQTLWQTWAM